MRLPRYVRRHLERVRGLRAPYTRRQRKIMARIVRAMKRQGY